MYSSFVESVKKKKTKMQQNVCAAFPLSAILF